MNYPAACCGVVHRPPSPTCPPTRLSEAAHLRPAASQAAAPLLHRQRTTAAPQPSDRRAVPRSLFPTASILSSGRILLSPVRLRDDSPPRDPQAARTPVMCRVPINPFHCPDPVSLACRAMANYHPRPAHEAVLPFSAPLTLDPRLSSCSLPGHLLPGQLPPPPTSRAAWQAGPPEPPSQCLTKEPKQIPNVLPRPGSVQARLAGGPTGPLRSPIRWASDGY